MFKKRVRQNSLEITIQCSIEVSQLQRADQYQKERSATDQQELSVTVEKQVT